MSRPLKDIADDVKAAALTIASSNAAIAKALGGVDVGDPPQVLVNVNGQQVNLLDLADELVAAVAAQSQP